ncbi:hypothetical protein BKA67DRAFT_658444 [Truncatella angustata]|uniref:AMP-activated protein kinase glycogen-binding domain-containing protein n=1 Tax=Truncatella angustata TaxID=152316 RepID=A0A9P8UL76_9PEZI|nr:uncharacterized protein BKA67DRAFT_658444 [Truncatella angustata]KAH6654121.1 hypothetical protein BKA67DRAFT_658444 [Truncatella angustata]
MGKRQVNLTYRKAGTQPPVFVAGTFSDPAWQPYEMACSKNGSGEYAFEHIVSADPGTEIQYKFRLGTGDWWACDDTTATATDSQGNTNNTLRIGRLSIDDGDFEDEDALPEDEGPPVFSHECFGSPDVPPDASNGSDDESPNVNKPSRPSRASRPSITAKPIFEDSDADEEIDYDDPRLEHFPYENRRSIIAQLQRIETNTGRDRSLPAGIAPISPLVSPTGLTFSPATLEPELVDRRSSAPRSSRGSLHSERSHTSLASIGEIIEEEESEGSKGSKHQQTVKNAPPGTYDTADFTDISESQGSTALAAHSEKLDTPIVRLEAPSSDEDEGISLSTGNSIKKSRPAYLRKPEPKSPIDRPISSASTNSINDISKQNNWLHSFFKVVFVDWIGHFFSNILFGNKRKA